jgi:hypothetical protein
MRQQHIFFSTFILIFSHFGVLLSSVADVFYLSRKLKMKFTTKQGVEEEVKEKNLNKWDH